MRSRAGVGMTPPKVLGELYPSSSVMMSSTLGAPFGGTIRGAHHGVDSEALSLMMPPNGGLGGGSCLPSIDVVAVGEPRTPVTCWAMAGATAKTQPKISAATLTPSFERSWASRFMFALLKRW